MARLRNISKAVRNKPLAIVGSYPPPYGGIGVHLQRLVNRLEDEGIDFVLYNTVSTSQKPPNVVSVSRHKILWYLGFCLRHRHKVVHLVATNWLSRLMFGLIACFRPGRYVLSIHGRSISESLESGVLRAALTRWLLRKMDVVIACNTDIERECVEDVGLEREKVHMIPAFIPPDVDRASELPECVQGFINSHNPLLCAVVAIGQTYKGNDIYGIDMMIELVERLKPDHPQIGLVLSVTSGADEITEQTVEACRRRVDDNMFIITEPLEQISHLIQSSDIFLRPTNTDGDAVSVREALWLNTPVVASDAVPRPEPCVLFRTRNMDDFELKVRRALSELPVLKQRVKSCEKANNADSILEIYKQLKEGTE